MPDVPRLLRPRADIDSALRAQVEAGRAIRGRAENFSPGDDLEQLDADFTAWHDRNQLLLRKFFSTEEPLESYLRKWSIYVDRGRVQDRLSILSGNAANLLEGLHSLVANLDLYDDAPEYRPSTLEERDTYLRAAWEVARGKTDQAAEARLVRMRSGLDEAIANDAENYLTSEGLIEWMTFGTIKFTHQGRKMMEAGLSLSESPTQAAQIILNVLSSGSTVQIAGDNATQVSDVTNVTESAEVLALLPPLIERYHQVLEETGVALNPQQAGEVSAAIATIEAHAGSTLPDKTILRRSLGVLQRVAENTGGSLAATGITQALSHAVAALQ